MLSSGPFFSIVIPTYNRGHMIAKAVQSVVSQQFKDWELVIVDDGSTDNTREIISGFHDRRIRYFHQPNAGRSAARNLGIEYAQGKYLCFLDSDDYYTDFHLSGLAEKIRQQDEPVAMLYTSISFEKQGHISPETGVENTFADIKEFILKASIGTPQACVHKSILKEFCFNPLVSIGEDQELWIRIVGKYPLIHIPQYSIIALEHEQRSVNVHNQETYREWLRTLRIIFAPGHPGHQVQQKVKNEILSNCYFGLAKAYIYNKNSFAAIKYLLKSTLTAPGHSQNKHRALTLLKVLFNIQTEYS